MDDLLFQYESVNRVVIGSLFRRVRYPPKFGGKSFLSCCLYFLLTVTNYIDIVIFRKGETTWEH